MTHPVSFNHLRKGLIQLVSICHTASYELNAVSESVDAHFDQLCLDELLSPGMKVVIKPNLLMKRTPEEGTTTHPSLVEAVVKKLQSLGVTDITIADSPGGVYSKPLLTGIYRATGMENVARRLDVQLNEDVGSTYVSNPNGAVCKGFDLINPIVEADFVISIAKLKTHCMAGLSGAVKNLFGCVPGLTKPEFHWRYPEEKDFCNMLVDLCETVKPDITFVDAVVSMEGDGPSSGNLRETGMTLCAASPYELDLVLSKIIHRPPEQIYTIVNAAERGLCTLSPENVEVCGDSLLEYEDFKQPRSKGIDFMAFVPAPLRPVAKPAVNRFFAPRPQVKKSVCIGCGKCAESCPAKTIRIENRKAHILHENCIKCYCCHEMCPVKAIHVKRNPILHL